MAITAEPSGLVIRRRWLRGKHFVMLAIITAATGGLAYAWNEYGFQPWMIFALLFVTSWDFMVLGMFVNSTTITAAQGRVTVKHGPIPTILYQGQDVANNQIEQLYAAAWNGMFEVGAILKDKSRIPLVRPLITQEQALFVEQQLERRLGITDVAVAGEVGSDLPLPDEVPAPVPKSVGAGLAFLPIVLVPAVLAFMFFVVMVSEVKGSLEIKGPRLSPVTFEPGDCSSGQRRGFFGVELTPKDGKGPVLRLIQDPVDGAVLAIQEPGKEPVKLTPKDCKVLQIGVTQTNTSINDVWNVEGSAVIECEEAKGSLEFAGCH